MSRAVLLEGLAVAAAGLAALVPLSPSTVERWFSTGAYPYLQRALTPVTDRMPFAVLDALVILAVGAVAATAVAAVRAARRGRRARAVLAAAGHLAAAAAVLYVAFLLLWGMNYRRVPMTERLMVEQGPPSEDAVLDLGVRAALELNRLHGEAHRTAWEPLPWENDALREAFAGMQRRLADAPAAIPARLKTTLLAPYFRWVSIDGMVNPFGLEVLANPDLLPFERAFVAAHEWAHLAGFADESEASYVAWLTCVRADPASAYSGWLALFSQVYGELDASARRRLDDALESGPRDDLRAAVDRVRRTQRPWLRAAGWRLYDGYLRANRVEEGVRSYGAVVTLILRARVDAAGNPIRRAARRAAEPTASSGLRVPASDPTAAAARAPARTRPA